MRLQGLGLKQIFNILLQHSIWKVNRSSLFLESETQRILPVGGDTENRDSLSNQ